MKARKFAWLVIFIISLCICFTAYDKLTLAYPCVSYRFLQPVKAISTDDNTIGTAYWYSQEAIVFSGKKSCKTDAIYVYGNPYLCYPMVFLKGSYSGEPLACAISDALAFKLFNSTDVIGLTLTQDNKEYKISGIFKYKSEIIICTALKTDSFYNVEIQADLKQANIDAAAQGLPSPSFIIDGQVVKTVFGFVLFFPIIIAAVILILRLFCFVKNKQLLAFIILIFAACALPFALNALPDFLIPSKFSDFGFYESLVENASLALKQWFLLPPFLKDLAAKYAMTQCALASLMATISCVKYLKI